MRHAPCLVCFGPWAFSVFFHSQVFRGLRGQKGGRCAKSLCIRFTAVISFIRSWHPSSDCKAKVNLTRKSLKSISMLNWICVYDMSCNPPNPPPSPASISPSIVLNAPLPPFHSRVVEQDPGEIIELQFWNRLNSVSTEQSGAAACQASSWAGLTTLSFRGGNVEWRGKGGRALQEVPMHY